MAFIPVPNTVLLELVYTWDGQICENTLYFQGVAPWDATNMLALAADARAWWVDNIRANVSNTVSLDRIRVTSLDSQNAPGVEFTELLPATGTNASASLPNNVSASIQFITALRGRSFRGRNYVVGLTEDSVDGNLVIVARASAYTAAYGLLGSTVNENGAVHVVVSRFSNNAPRATGVATPVTAYSFERVIDSQRRRLPGRGA